MRSILKRLISDRETFLTSSEPAISLSFEEGEGSYEKGGTHDLKRVWGGGEQTSVIAKEAYTLRHKVQLTIEREARTQGGPGAMQEMGIRAEVLEGDDPYPMGEGKRNQRGNERGGRRGDRGEGSIAASTPAGPKEGCLVRWRGIETKKKKKKN